MPGDKHVTFAYGRRGRTVTRVRHGVAEPFAKAVDEDAARLIVEAMMALNSERHQNFAKRAASRGLETVPIKTQGSLELAERLPGDPDIPPHIIMQREQWPHGYYEENGRKTWIAGKCVGEACGVTKRIRFPGFEPRPPNLLPWETSSAE